MMINHENITNGFSILTGVLAPYIARELKNEYGEQWWNEGVLDKLYADQSRDLPYAGTWAELVDSLDIARCLLLIDIHWQQVFRKKLSIDYRSWIKELQGVRNKWAHIGGVDFSDDDTWRALDTMSRIADGVDSTAAEELRALLRTVRYGSEEGSTAGRNEAPQTLKKNEGILTSYSYYALPSWRDVIEPHPDVAQGRYKNAEFAADLAQVARGEGSYEYRDPVEFFNRTYITEGMTGLLVQAIKRVTGGDGEPVIQLKTAFGGGKTHSMLALYHLLRGKTPIEKIPVVKPVLKAAGVTALPKCNVAVLVGTSLDPSSRKRPNYLPGITVNTLWGEMASQLVESSGNTKLYDYIKEADKKGVSPGSAALRAMFNACGPCVILIDELVAYAKKIYGVDGLPAGSSDNLISFIQEITEAARASKNSMVVASIPESDIEIGGDAGKIALETIEHTFGRMESIWKPVSANEGFEVVRRRLFLTCKDEAARDAVCSAFSEMYASNPADFPFETKELEYKQRLISCYPIHPEVFDRLYKDWATLERFQRTRGVLRLMAAVVHELWMGRDSSLMIMPGSLPLDVPNVRDELTRHLSENWNAIVDREVDGRNSIPYLNDRNNPRFGGILASRRVARAIMLGSAPTARGQNIKGIEASRIRLGVIQPGETISNFNDALSMLQSSLSYLYSNTSNDRFWYDTRPTLKKTVADRASQIPSANIDLEIERRLRALRITRRDDGISGVHVCPNSSLDVPDEQNVRLVILGCVNKHKYNKDDSEAITTAGDILNNRGGNPRIYRNTLAFIAADSDLMNTLQMTVRQYLAWDSINRDSEALNLDKAQIRETEENRAKCDKAVDGGIDETYCWLLVPEIDRSADLKTVIWDATRINGSSGSIIERAADKMKQTEALILQWAPSLLLIQLDNLLWKDGNDIQVKKLWEFLSTYCYLPRLASYEVLENTIKNGVNSDEYFALAASYAGGRYVDLKFNKSVEYIDKSYLLVRRDIAREQIEKETPKTAEPVDITPRGGEPPVIPQGTPVKPTDTVDEPKKQPTHFYMSADIDTTRINREVQKLVEEIITHLSTSQDGTLSVTLEVNAESRAGFSVPTVRTVTENCRTMKVKDFNFYN